MATSIQLNHLQGYYRHYLDVWVAGQDTGTNQSRIGYRYWVHHDRTTNGAWTTLNNCQFTVTIDGQTHTASPNFDFRNGNRDITMMQGEFTVAHDSDGSLTVALYFANETLSGGSLFNASSQSGSFVVNTIPRASQFTITPNPVTSGDDITITVTAASTAFTHDLVWHFDGNPGAISSAFTGATEYSIAFTPDIGWIGTDPTATFSVQLLTYDGATTLGDEYRDVTLRQPPVYPEVGQGTPYDIRVRRIELVSGEMVAKEVISYLDLTVTDTLSASGTATLTVSKELYDTSLDEAVVVVEYFDGAVWLDTNMLLFLSRVQSDKADITNTVTYTGQSYVDYILSKGVASDDFEWTAQDQDNAGWIVGNYLTWGKARGWAPLVEKTFTDTATSVGTTWQNKNISLSVTKDTPLSQILDGLVSDIQVEYRSHFDATTGKALLDMYNPGYGYDWTVRGADPIVSLSTEGMYKVTDAAPVRKDYSEKLTRVNVRGDEASLTRELGSSVNPLFGHLEGSVAATGVKDTARLSQLGDAALQNQASGTVERTFTYDLSSTQTPSPLYPYRTFRPGDWILVPGDDGPEKARVSQVAITRDVEGTRATITVGDLIPNGIAATARKLTQAGGGSIAAGTLRTPLSIASAIPAAPVISSAIADGYWDPTGAPKAGVELIWSAVTESVAGSSVTVDLYEISSREEVGSPWVVNAITADTEITLSGLEINQTMDLRVRARSNGGVYGQYSDFETITTPEPATALDGPDISDLYTDGVGSIYVVWGGTLNGSPAPLRVAYVGAEVSSDGGTVYTPMGTPITAAGAIIVTPNAWGSYFVRLRVYDRLGNPGDASAPQEIEITDPHINPPTPAVPTGLTATAGAGWDASGYFPEAWFDLSWNAVTLDTDGNAVTVVGYDLWGKRTGEADLRFLTSVSGTTTARWAVEPGEQWSFRVGATSTFGGVSALSEPYVDSADAVISAAPAPAAPTLSQYAGLLNINWAGSGMQPYIKTVYATISTSSGGTYTRVGMPLLGPGTVVVPNLATGVTYYAKIVMVAEDGQISTSPASTGLLLNPITGVTIQTSSVANTGIKMTDAAFTAYDGSGNPTFILDATTGEVWIAPYDAVFELGATGEEAETGNPTTGIAISSEGSSFNTFIHPSGVQIRNDQTPLSWWEADASDASLVNFVSPRARVDQRMRIGDYEFLRETKTTGTRLVVRYKGA